MILAKERPAKSASDAKGLAVALRQEFLTEAHSIITSGGLAYRCRQEVLQVYIEGSAGVKGDAAGDKGKPSGVKSDGTGVEGKASGVKSKASGAKSNGMGFKGKASGIKSDGTGVEGKGAGNTRKSAGDIPNSTAGSIPADDPPNINSLINVMGEDATDEGEDLNYDTDRSDGFAEEAFTPQSRRSVRRNANDVQDDIVCKAATDILEYTVHKLTVNVRSSHQQARLPFSLHKRGVLVRRFHRRFLATVRNKSFEEMAHTISRAKRRRQGDQMERPPPTRKPLGKFERGHFRDCSASILPACFEASSVEDSDSLSAIAAQAIFGTDVHLCDPTTDLTRIYDVVFCCFRRSGRARDSKLADAPILQNDDHEITARLRALYNTWETQFNSLATPHEEMDSDGILAMTEFRPVWL